VTRLRAAVPYAAVFAVALYLYHATDAFAAMGREGQLSPAFWPRAVLGLLMLVCAWEIGRAAWFPRDARAAPVAAAQLEEAPGEPPRQPLRLAAGIALTAAYVPAMEALGFFIATAIYLAAFMVVGRYRRPFVVAIASIGGSLAFVFVFMKVVYVSLPLGMGPFRAFSASLLAALGIH
jgi:putative tricarboxylic transport membrane protein